VSNSRGHPGSTWSGTASIAVRRLRRIRLSSQAYRVSSVGLLALSLAVLALVVSKTEVSASPSGTTSLSVKGSLAAVGKGLVAKPRNPAGEPSIVKTSTLTVSKITHAKKTRHRATTASSAGRKKSPAKVSSSNTARTTTVQTSKPPAPTTTVQTSKPPAPTTTVQTSKPPAPTTTASPAANTAYPVGVVDSSAPSGYDPPTANALAGYTESYVTDFPGASLPNGWSAYNGSYAMDPGGQFDSANAVVSGGILSLNTSRDPNYGNAWATGGVCYCVAAPTYGALTYGAFFVRSRVTGPGPATVELLWPESNGWPPEIDFNETDGTTNSTTSTVHWGPSNTYFRVVSKQIDMTKWHTWGVIWTPNSIIYTVDGVVWSSVSSNSAQIPDVPMHLAIQQQTWCGGSPVWACPTSPQSMQINWVALYSPNS
jgi:hypothetical protein